MGDFGSRYLLSAECAENGQIVLLSESSLMNPDVRSVALPSAAPGPYAVALEFNPEDRVMTVLWNGKIVLQHLLRFLVTARSQVYFGEDPSLGNQDAFTGHIRYSPPQMFKAASGK